MKSSRSFHLKKKTFEDNLVSKERFKLNAKVLGFIYFDILLLITLIVLIELKEVYNIDIFYNMNTPFDDLYFEVKKAFY